MVLCRYETIPSGEYLPRGEGYDEDNDMYLRVLLHVYQSVDVERTVIITASDRDSHVLGEHLTQDDHNVSILLEERLFDTRGYHDHLREFCSRETRVLIMSYPCYRFLRDHQQLPAVAESHDFIVFFDVDVNISREVYSQMTRLHTRGYTPTSLKYRALYLLS